MRPLILAILAAVIAGPTSAAPNVQSATCYGHNGGQLSFACCANDAWASLLWVHADFRLASSEAVRAACTAVSASFNAWNGMGNCDLNTEIFESGSPGFPAHKLGELSSCKISQWKPF